jgi:hypothetical protein
MAKQEALRRRFEAFAGRPVMVSQETPSVRQRYAGPRPQLTTNHGLRDSAPAGDDDAFKKPYERRNHKLVAIPICATRTQISFVAINHPLIRINGSLIAINRPLIRINDSLIVINRPWIGINDSLIAINRPLIRINDSLIAINRP